MLNVISDVQILEKMVILLQKPFDYVIDAIDSITPKFHLIKTALEMGGIVWYHLWSRR